MLSSQKRLSICKRTQRQRHTHSRLCAIWKTRHSVHSTDLNSHYLKMSSVLSRLTYYDPYQLECALNAYDKGCRQFLSNNEKPKESFIDCLNQKKYMPYIDTIINDMDHAFLDMTDTLQQDAQAYVWYPKHRVLKTVIYICFRGTVNFGDMKANLNFHMVPAGPEGVKVHKGYFNQYQSLHYDLFKKVSLQLPQHITNPASIIFTGHSLGGALATLGAFSFGNLLIDNPFIDIHCYSFGSPKVGNDMFASSFHNVVDFSARMYNKLDPIPLLPSLPWYSHVSPSICLCEHKQNTDTDQVLVEPLGDHNMSKYITNVFRVWS